MTEWHYESVQVHLTGVLVRAGAVAGGECSNSNTTTTTESILPLCIFVVGPKTGSYLGLLHECKSWQTRTACACKRAISPPWIPLGILFTSCNSFEHGAISGCGSVSADTGLSRRIPRGFSQEETKGKKKKRDPRQREHHDTRNRFFFLAILLSGGLGRTTSSLSISCDYGTPHHRQQSQPAFLARLPESFLVVLTAGWGGAAPRMAYQIAGQGEHRNIG